MIQNDLIATVDQLADIRSQIKDLENQEVKLRSTLVNSGVSTVWGNSNVAVIENYLQSLVNWQKIARDLKATQQKIAGNTRKDIRWRVRIKPRVLQ
jgi:hypothetical protein